MSPPTATMLLLVSATALLVVATTGADNPTAKEGCQSSCGGVDIPYPFGIGANCFRPGFEILCDNSNVTLIRKSSSMTSLVRVLSLNVTPRAEIRVETKVAYECFDILGNRTDDFPGGLNVSATSTRDVYRISNSRNELYVLGCNTFIYTGSGEPARNAKSYYGGCVAYCKNAEGPKDGACEGIGCCHVDLPPDLTDTSMQLNQGWSHEGLEYSPCNYAFIVEKGSYSFKAADLRDMPRNQTMPLLLDWAIRDSTSCSNLKESACVSINSRCAASDNGPGYVCQCSDGYKGNPYIQNGCQGIVLGLSLIVIALLLALVFFQKRQLDKSFEKNGGKVLQNVKGLTIFSKEGLKKITRNNSDFLGNGAFGNVYKGTLPDDTIVAVKGSIVVNEESRKDFTDEVEIQTNMIHKNILRLVGCCLEVEVPMLVYEFAANGSLQDILHQKKNQELPLDLRLDIAIGAAEGLKYMHSSTAQAIRHGDVKPDNILLDENLTPKISDFGLSKLNIEGQFAKKVVGCMGYVDPVFLKTGLLTQKSDVYSFGAVLLELITGKKNVYGENQSLIIDFCKCYEKENSGRAMFDTEIANEEDMFVLEEISKLAIECLCEDIEERPDMTEVAERLVMLRRDKKLKKTLGTYGSLEDITMAGSPIQQRT
ncbi:putative wall-associated receptor kinase-like 16 [Lolium rigidum]|uniref:putative wall-associated receptor kinase-like 16 n=1 Tax=Lolium rigidum TaxID=89674 RepID=UPI001F5D48EB|nr:putative wall-associated receptor kinase-like 16 [Lolium rigidum]